MHYEYLEEALGQCSWDYLTALADALQKDNPNFRRERFMHRILECSKPNGDTND
jgi:hypothetical protein